MLMVNSRIQIPDSEFEFQFSRSSGPGGQNVNKVNSKALLRWNPTTSASLPPDVRERFLNAFGMRLTSLGELLITSDRHRDRIRNQEDCLEKLREILLSIAVAPKRRKKTKPSRSSVRKAQEGKKQHSKKKEMRRRVL